MKKISFVILFVSTQLLLLVLQLYKHADRVRLVYAQQKKEAQRAHLIERREHALQKMHELTGRSEIKRFAQEQLKLEPIQLRQLKKVVVSNDKNNL